MAAYQDQFPVTMLATKTKADANIEKAEPETKGFVWAYRSIPLLYS
jgi:hypothetical protein